MVSFLLSVTFGCGVFIAVAHVVNYRFIAPGVAIVCRLALARRTIVDVRERRLAG